MITAIGVERWVMLHSHALINMESMSLRLAEVNISHATTPCVSSLAFRADLYSFNVGELRWQSRSLAIIIMGFWIHSRKELEQSKLMVVSTSPAQSLESIQLVDKFNLFQANCPPESLRGLPSVALALSHSIPLSPAAPLQPAAP